MFRITGAVTAAGRRQETDDRSMEEPSAMGPRWSTLSRRWLKGEVRGTVAALFLSAFVGLVFLWYRAREQAVVVSTIRALGGKVTYSCDLPFASRSWPPRWVRTWLGNDCCFNAVGVDLAGTAVTDAQLQVLTKLVSLRYLSLSNTPIGDAGVRHLSTLKQLEELTLRKTNITDAGLSCLAECQNLRLLYVQDTTVSDDGLMQLAQLPNLTAVFAINTQVTDDGAEQFHEAAPAVLLQTEMRRRPARSVMPLRRSAER